MKDAFSRWVVAGVAVISALIGAGCTSSSERVSRPATPDVTVERYVTTTSVRSTPDSNQVQLSRDMRECAAVMADSGVLAGISAEEVEERFLEAEAFPELYPEGYLQLLEDTCDYTRDIIEWLCDMWVSSDLSKEEMLFELSYEMDPELARRTLEIWCPEW